MTDTPCIIGSSTIIRGHLSGDEDLTVEGRVEGEITLTSHLSIAPAGAVSANIDVAELTVEGALRGDTRATGHVIIAAGARAVGAINATHVIIEDGAQVKGRIEMPFDLPEGIEA